MNIHHLVYVSTATLPLELDDIRAIERISIVNNNKAGLTGVLTYCDCKFMQFLEGQESQVDHIFSKIKKDSRHHSIDILRYEFIAERQFSGWHMRYTDINEIHETNGTVCNKIYDIQDNALEVFDKAIESITLLMAFKNSCSEQIYTKQMHPN